MELFCKIYENCQNYSIVYILSCFVQRYWFYSRSSAIEIIIIIIIIIVIIIIIIIIITINVIIIIIIKIRKAAKNPNKISSRVQREL